jgi:transcriptional regulator with XRE-family HTH domain
MLSVMSMGLRGRPATTETEDTLFGAWLRQERMKRGWSGEMLAERAGTSQSIVSAVERGSRPATEEMAERLADALAGPDADDATRQRMVKEAVGLVLSKENRAVRVFDPDDPAIEMMDAYDDLPLELQQSLLDQIKATARALRSQRTDIIGKRAEDGGVE